MAKEIKGEKMYVLEERLKIISDLFSKDYSDADIARIMFNVHRSTITNIRNKKNEN